ncbi:MAG: RsmE family RNA methyltransferase [Christensenellales bacterium]
MEPKRFFVDKKDIEQDIVKIHGEEFHHLTKVLRYKVGFELIACDNSGYDYYARLTSVKKDCAYAQIYKKEENQRETIRELTLCQAVCKEIDFIAQKAAELGIVRLIPFTSQFTNNKDFNHLRLQKIAVNASKQCGRAKITQILPLVDFAAMLDYTEDGECIFFYEESKEKFRLNPGVNKPIYIIIGSEGGFSKEEVELAASRGISTFSLGKRILRAETAAICGTLLTLDKLGELD